MVRLKDKSMNIILKTKNFSTPAEISGEEIYTEKQICPGSEFNPGDREIKPFYATNVGVIIKHFGAIELIAGDNESKN